MLAIGFEWRRGHRLEFESGNGVKATSAAEALSVAFDRITQIGSGFDTVRPLDIRPTLYLEFEKLDGSAKDCLSFARKWGLLRARAEEGASESLQMWRHEISSMREALKSFSPGSLPASVVTLAHLNMDLVLGEEGRVTFRMRPTCLMDALWLQFGQRLTGGRSLTSCKQCGGWFEVGSKGKRVLARFCSVQCKNSYHNARGAKL